MAPVDAPLSLPEDRATNPPPPDESQESGGTSTNSVLLLSPPTEEDKKFKEDKEFTPIRATRGVHTTPLQARIPIEVITPPVATRNSFI